MSEEGPRITPNEVFLATLSVMLLPVGVALSLVGRLLTSDGGAPFQVAAGVLWVVGLGVAVLVIVLRYRRRHR